MTEEPQKEAGSDSSDKQNLKEKNEGASDASENQCSKTAQELADYKEKYLRTLAELENQRKRLQKEKQETVKFAVQSIIVDFLSPLDNMEHALKFAGQGSEEVRQWALGFEMIVNQFKDVLFQNGVTTFDSKGSLFDPDSHEALEAVESTEHPPGTIIEEFRRGYKMDNRTIRAAKVKVSKPAAKNESSEQ